MVAALAYAVPDASAKQQGAKLMLPPAATMLLLVFPAPEVSVGVHFLIRKSIARSKSVGGRWAGAGAPQERWP